MTRHKDFINNMSAAVMSTRYYPNEDLIISKSPDRMNTPLSRSHSHPVQVLHNNAINGQNNGHMFSQPYSQDRIMNNTNGHRRLDRRHSDSEDRQQRVNSSRYKTELCRPFEENGHCKYGDKCQFAHGERELRSLTRHPKYKTEMCRTFHTIGLCPYGPRCHFVHADEMRPKHFASTFISDHFNFHNVINNNNNANNGNNNYRPRPLSLSPNSVSPTSSLSESPTSMLAFFPEDESPFVYNTSSPPYQQVMNFNNAGLILDSPPSPVSSLSSELEFLSLSPGPDPQVNDHKLPLRLPVFSRLSHDDPM